MRLLSWNIQWCRGVDGRVDPARIADTARALCDPDLLCLQEVAVNFPGLEGSQGEDQVAALCARLPGYAAAYGWGVDLADDAGGRRRFGNLILSRLPITRIRRLALPWPAAPGTQSMPRVVVEVEVVAPWGSLRVGTTHLEYYSKRHRAAQIEQLRALHAEAHAHAAGAPPLGTPGTPYHPQPRPRAAIVTGDFNLTPDDPLHARLVAPFDDGTPALRDAWSLAHPATPHAPSFRLYDPKYTGEPYCCDFAFVSEDLAPRLKDVRIDAACQASDHQPVIVEFSD